MYCLWFGYMLDPRSYKSWVLYLLVGIGLSSFTLQVVWRLYGG